MWGFTLLEILISTVILVLVTTGLASVFLAGRRHLMRTRSKIQAAELGRLFLAPLQSQVRQDQWGSNCLTGAAGCPGAQSIGSIPYTPTYDISDVNGTTLRKVKVTINWPKSE